MSDSPRFSEGSFIKPSRDRMHKFMCMLCKSTKLRFDFNPYKGELTLSCDNCGNFVSMNFGMGNEVPDGR